MKRAILLLTVLCVTFLASCNINTTQYVRTDEQWHGQLRQLALDIIKSEGGFFPEREIYQKLLDEVNNTDPRIKPSLFKREADTLCQYWRCEIGGEGTKKFYVEICFQSWFRNVEGRLFIGLVDLIIVRKIGEDTVEFRMRSVRPLEVTDYIRILDESAAEYRLPDLKSGNTTQRVTALFAKPDRGL